MKKTYLIIITLLILSSVITAQSKMPFFPDLDGNVSASYLDNYKNIKPVNTITPSALNNPLVFTMYPGFPAARTYATFSPKTGPIYCNMDADADLEIVFAASQNLCVINLDTSSVPGWPKKFPVNSEIAWAPSYGDIDGDGQGELVVGVGGTVNGWIYAYKQDGTVCPGFPVVVGKYPLSPTLADLDNDGKLEIIMGTRVGQVVVYKGDGTALAGWPKWMDRYIAASVSVGDLENDGIKEVVAESRNLLWVWDQNGNQRAGFPFAVTDSLVESNSYSAPVIADIDNNGSKEIIFSSHSSSATAGGITYVVKNDGTLYPGWPKTIVNWIYSAPSVADVNNDGNLEIFTADYVSSADPLGYIYGYTKDGTLLPNFPIGPLFGSAIQLLLADIDNDNQLEIVADQNIQVGDLGRYVAYNMDGTPVAGFPIEFTKNSTFQQPILGDLNHDGTMDMIGGSMEFMGTYQYNSLAWNTGLPYASAKIANKMYMYSERHEGYYNNAPVPVELASFSSAVVGNQVILNWQTVTEKNNKGFEVQRNSAGNWQTLAFVNGNGTSLDKHNYSYTDKNLAKEKYSYRLKQIDYDGQFEYSKVIDVDVNTPTQFMLNQNYPNPFNPTTMISFSLPAKGMTSLKVYDLLGKEVSVLLSEEMTEGQHTVSFDASALTSGVYMYKLQSGSNVMMQKMMVIK